MPKHVHSILPPLLTDAVGKVLGAAGIAHVAHGDSHPHSAAELAAGDPEALALIGPHRSLDVAEAVEVTAPAGLPLVAPFATWAGVTRDDEPGCDGPQDDDPANHRGTVMRIVARDTVVAARVAQDVRDAGRRALVVAGEHDYGRQLDGQLLLAGLPRAPSSGQADLVVLAGLADEPEVQRAAELAPLPVLAFDGVQGADLGAGRDVHLALPTAPRDGVSHADVLAGAGHAQDAAHLVVMAVQEGADDRAAMLRTLRALGRFDDHGDRPDASLPVWLWRADDAWTLTPDRAI